MNGQQQGISRDELSVELNQEFDDLVSSIDANNTLIGNHKTDYSNPHNVTKAQVGLGNVPNTDFTAAIADKEATANKSNSVADYLSTIKFPTWNAIVTYIFGRVDVNVPITISASRSLTDADSGLIIIITASCTVTIAAGLKSGFNCTFVTLSGVMLTLALGSGVVVFNNVGLSMSEKSSCTLNRTITSNNFLLMGSV